MCKTTIVKEKDRTSVEFQVKTTKQPKFLDKTTNSLAKFTWPYKLADFFNFQVKSTELAKFQFKTNNSQARFTWS